MRNAPDKNPFRSVRDLLSRAAPSSRNKHFFAYLIDIILVGIVSYLVFLAGNAIVTNTDSYKNDYARYETEITYYQDMVIEAHLSEYIDRDTHLLADDEDLAVKMAISQILLSYENDNPSARDFMEDPSIKLKQYYSSSFYQDAFIPISFDNDYISQFFIKYVATHNQDNDLVVFNDLTPEEFNVAYYKKYLSGYDKLKFVINENDPSIPYLRPDVANDLYRYLVRDEGSSRDAYDSFTGFYTSLLSNAQGILFRAKSYQDGRYQDYLMYRHNITQAIDTTLIISIVIATYLIVFLPQLIFKDCRSFGKIFMRLGTINIDKSGVQIWKQIIRSVLYALSSLYLAFFLVLLPPFNGSSMLLYLPYITIGSFDITLLTIVIVMFILSAINGICMLLTHEKRSITDLIFYTITVDVTTLDEPDYDERNEAYL